MSRLTQNGTAEPVSRDQILRHERGQGHFHFSCSADHVQDWQPYTVINTLAIYVTIHTSLALAQARAVLAPRPNLINGYCNHSLLDFGVQHLQNESA